MFYIIRNINIQAHWIFVLMESDPPKFLTYSVVIKITNFDIRETWVQITVFCPSALRQDAGWALALAV